MTDEIDVDALYDQVMAPEVGISDPSGPDADSSPTTVAPTASTSSIADDAMVTINWRGKDVSLPFSKVKNFAQQAYSYSEDNRTLKSERESFESERQQHLAEMEEIRRIDAYARENPQWLSHWQQAYQAAQQQQQQQPYQGQSDFSNPLQPVVQTLQQQVAELQSHFASHKEQAQTEAESRATKQLDEKISAYREEHPYFDWNTPDDNGQTLEDRVIQYAADNNIGRFNVAADSMLMQQIIDKRVELAKADTAKQIQKQHKLGRGQITDKSQKDAIVGKHRKGMRYDDVMGEVYKELGIA